MTELKKINLESLTAQELLIGENFQSLKQQAYTYIDNLDLDAALDFARKIEVRFHQFKPANNNEQHWYDILKYWISRLKFFAFASLNEEERQNLIQNNVLEIVRRGVDLKSYIFEYLAFYGSKSMVEQEANSLIVLLRNNQELLGKNLTTFKQLNFFPTIGNWCAQYQILLNQRKLKEIKPGIFELTTFFNTNQYIKYLSEDEKAVLKLILDLFNWLSAPVVLEAALPWAPKPQIPQTKLPPRPAQSFNALAQAKTVSPAVHGADLEVLKRKIEGNKVNFVPQKPAAPAKASISPAVEEIKRELRTPELPAGQPAENPKMSLATLNDIKVIDDFKHVTLEHLRQGLLYNQIALIKSKIMYLAQVNNVLPYYTVNAFEQSPLFKLYLSIGSEVIHDNNLDRATALKQAVAKSGSNLTLAEFEAIADLRKEIERL